MNLIKKWALGLILLLLFIEGLSAQEKKSYIKPTFGLGFGAASELFCTALSMDIDFVNKIGFTFGLKNIFIFNSYGAENIIPLGFGYTYDGEKWALGGKLIVGSFSDLFGIGFDINGTYWLKENIGFTGMFDLYFPEEFIFSTLRMGVSYKY